MQTRFNEHLIVTVLQNAYPNLLAAYLFGSHAQANAGPESDFDLAVLLVGRAEPMSLWELSQEFANQIGCEIDLIDLRAASTVMQHQVITTGRILWAKDEQATIYESFILSEKTALNTMRAGLIRDIERDGRIYGR